MRTRAVACLLLFIAISAMLIVGIDGAHERKDVQIVFEEKSSFSSHEKEVIAEHFKETENGGGHENTVDNIICTILGHAFGEWEDVTTIVHKVYSSHPRCEEKIYKTRICSRCYETEQYLISTTRIPCCE